MNGDTILMTIAAGMVAGAVITGLLILARPSPVVMPQQPPASCQYPEWCDDATVVMDTLPVITAGRPFLEHPRRESPAGGEITARVWRQVMAANANYEDQYERDMAILGRKIEAF